MKRTMQLSSNKAGIANDRDGEGFLGWLASISKWLRTKRGNGNERNER